jgi:hypothetical protein
MNRHRRMLSTALTLALAFAWGALQPATAAEGKIPNKMKKQMRVMEGMLDSILLDSPNLLVSGSHASNALYLDEFGVILTLEASLTGQGFDFSRSLNFLRNIRVESDKDKTVIYHEGSGEDDEDTLAVARDRDKDDDAIKKEKKVYVLNSRGDHDEEREAKSEKEIYAQGKQELIDALADYGETLTALRDDQWVAIAAFLKDSDFFKDRQISRLVIKARVRDLRDSDKLSREDLVGRFVVEEY